MDNYSYLESAGELEKSGNLVRIHRFVVSVILLINNFYFKPLRTFNTTKGVDEPH